MARISYQIPTEIENPQTRAWLERSIAEGRPGPEIQSIRTHSDGVTASFNQTREWLFQGGVLEYELKELMRAYIATSASCTYCVEYGLSKSWKESPDEMSNLINYETSTEYSHREKIALRYADAIMWDPALATDELWALLREEFTEEELVELGYWIGFTYGGQRWIKTLNAKQGELDIALAAAEHIAQPQ
jgi:alkylhydroperoxidase family enzyme